MPNLPNINPIPAPKSGVANNPNNNRFTGSLSGPDVSPGNMVPGATSRTTSGGIGVTGIGHSSSVGSGRGLPCNIYQDPDYVFSVDSSGKVFISEEVLHRYLDRVLQVEWLSVWDSTSDGLGLTYPVGYDPYTNFEVLYDPTYDHGAILQMIVDVGAKFVFDMTSLNGCRSYQNVDWICTTLKHDIDFIHCHDSQVICGAVINETCYGFLDGIPLPTLSSGALDLDFIGKFYPGPALAARLSLPNPTYFIQEQNMLFDYNGCHAGTGDKDACYYDLTLPEARMWYYYQATKLIDAGCEAIHFGDLFYATQNDLPVLKNLWDLVSLIRLYAVSHARRGIVLLDTHIVPAGAVDTPYSTQINGAWYYDPPSGLGQDWEKQLIFDFHSSGPFYNKNPNWATNCYDGTFFGDSFLPVLLENDYGLLNNSKGGLNPQGWYCTHNPTLSYFDNSDNDLGSGCNYNPGIPNPPLGSWGYPYGYENTSWYVNQQPYLRLLIIKYNYYKTKCLDPNCHVGMPGRLIYHTLLGPGSLDQCYNASPAEASTIKDIWSGVYAGPFDWEHHNFTVESTVAGPGVVGPASDLVFAGTDKMYYIGTDGYIHGYVKVNDNFNDGYWVEATPSYAAQVPVGAQVKAQSGLVASPDGNHLLYIGMDGYIHGFNINAFWDYYYFDFMKVEMMAQSIKATGSLIFPTPDRIYYTATYYVHGPVRPIADPNSSDRVHGFQFSGGSWHTVSPTYSAQDTFGQSVSSQEKAGGALTYDSVTNRLYYKGINGLLYYYYAHTSVDYEYADCWGNAALNMQQLQILGDLALVNIGGQCRIYFVGQYQGASVGPEGPNSVYLLLDDGHGWGLLSLADNAQSVYGQLLSTQSVPAFGQIAVSPDGNTIGYFGAFQDICYYQFDGVNYYYDYMKYVNLIDVMGTNSIQFTGNNDLYYIAASTYSADNSYTVHHYKYEEAFCENPSVSDYESV